MSELITDLSDIARLAQERHDEFEVVRYMLEQDDDLTDAKLDARIDEIAAPIIAAIDCTQCANCCRSLNVYLTTQDAQRLAAGIDVPIDNILTEYVDRNTAQSEGEWGKFRAKPCAFLKGKLCSVYEHRPEACRLYPQFTPDFRWVLEDMNEGAALCPIIYNVLSQVADQIDDIIKNP
jgi:uncharacterized protein